MLKLDKEVIATPYPMKHIHWDQIWDRIQLGKIKSKDELMKSGYIFPIKMDNMIDPQKNEITVTNGVMEVSHAPTGCMLLKRQVFDKMIKAYPEDRIDQPTIVNGEAKSNPYMYNFFDTVHDQASKNTMEKTLDSVENGLQLVGNVIVILTIILHTLVNTNIMVD
jgi:hypothetical protein